MTVGPFFATPMQIWPTAQIKLPMTRNQRRPAKLAIDIKSGLLNIPNKSVFAPTIIHPIVMLTIHEETYQRLLLGSPRSAAMSVGD